MATTKATTLAHTLGGISSDISTAELNRLDGVTGDLQTQLDAKAPLASPTFTGTITAPNDSISGDAVSGGTIGAGTFNGTIGSSADFPSGVIINAKILTQATRTSIDSPNSTDRQILAFGNYNKLNSNTKLVIHIVAPAFNFNTSGGVGVGIRYGSGSTIWGGSHYYTAENYAGFLVAYYYTDNHTTTGNQAVSLRSGQASGTGGRPCGVINPNTTDDGRIPQSRSTAFIYEFI